MNDSVKVEQLLDTSCNAVNISILYIKWVYLKHQLGTLYSISLDYFEMPF